MKAIVIHAARDLRVEEQDAGQPGPGEVRVRMERGGICGSDLHYFNHGGFGAVRLREPMVLGHEVSGRIDALGPGVDGLAVGQLVAVSPSRPCGVCSYCLEGLPNHCLNMRFYGSAMPMPHIQGAFRQELIASASQCVPADGLTAAEAAMGEPLAVCLHAVRQAGEMLGKRVLITGAGPIGLLVALVARRAGAAEITVTDIADFTLAMAAKVGADRVINIRDTQDALTPFTANKGQFDVLFECSGVAAALAQAIPAVRPRGHIVQVGMSGDMAIPMQAITVKELTLSGTFRFHAEFATAITLMQKRLIDVTSLITHDYALADVHEAFAMANDRSQAMKVQIRLDG
jgi:L-idonate 5-dehydrogenase